MSNWDLMMPGMGLTAIGIAGVTISYAGIAHTFVDGMHALTGLTMFVGLIFLSAGILDGGVSTSNRAKATTLVVLAISLSFGAAALIFNSITTIPTFIGIMLIVAVPAIVMAYVSMKMPQYAKPIGIIFVLATGAAISAYVGFGLYGPSQYLVPQEEEIEEKKISSPSVPSAPITAISILKGSAMQGAPDYEPDMASVPTGNNIEWTNYDEVVHSVTSAVDAGETFNSNLINAGEKYLLDTSKLKSGTYDYMCIVHPWMKASFAYGETSQQPTTVPEQQQMESQVEVPAQNVAPTETAPSAEVPTEQVAPTETVPEETNTQSTSDSVTVEMTEGSSANSECADKCYVPNIVQVTVGGLVTWKNADTAAHTVTETNSKFDSSLVVSGGEYSYKFEEVGTYDYICIVHPWMKGQVIVG
ncbi:MAG: plastocyanin/azurin family copper-binding protein [Candidatus Nitrosotenuis sp.]